MSGQAIGIVQMMDNDAFESSGEKFTMLALASYYHEDTARANPSLRRLAEFTAQTPRTIQRQLKALEDRGLIERVEEFRSDGSQTSNLYVVPLFVNATKAAKQAADSWAQGQLQEGRQNVVPPQTSDNGGGDAASGLEQSNNNPSPNQTNPPDNGPPVDEPFQLAARGEGPPTPHRIPHDWRPNQQSIDCCRELGMTQGQMDEECGDFVDYWSRRTDKPSFKKPAGWQLTFRKRVTHQVQKGFIRTTKPQETNRVRRQPPAGARRHRPEVIDNEIRDFGQSLFGRDAGPADRRGPEPNRDGAGGSGNSELKGLPTPGSAPTRRSGPHD